MRKKVVGRVLGLSLALIMGMSVPVCAFAESGESDQEVIISIEEEEFCEEEPLAETNEDEMIDESSEVEMVEDADDFTEEAVSEEDFSEEAIVESDVIEETELLEETASDDVTEDANVSEESVSEEDVSEESATAVNESKVSEPAKTETYTITYDLGGIEGVTVVKPVNSYKTGKKVTLPKVKCPGYTFNGWLFDPAAESILVTKKTKVAGTEMTFATALNKTAAQDMTFTASLTPISIKVSIAANGSGVYKLDDTNKKIKVSGKKLLGTVDYTGNRDAEKCDFSCKNWKRTGYELVGFSANPKAKRGDKFYGVDLEKEDLSKLSTKKTATLYAIWFGDMWVIDYTKKAILLDGKNETEIDYVISDIWPGNTEYGTVLKLPKAELEGYTFLGWRAVNTVNENKLKKAKGYVTAVNANNMADVALQPVFKQLTYKLSYNAQGGTYNKKKKGVLKASVGYYEDIAELVAPLNSTNIKKKGYDLKGFALDAKGETGLVIGANGKPISEDGKLILKAVKAATLYAIWEDHKIPEVYVLSKVITKPGSDLEFWDSSFDEGTLTLKYDENGICTKAKYKDHDGWLVGQSYEDILYAVLRPHPLDESLLKDPRTEIVYDDEGRITFQWYWQHWDLDNTCDDWYKEYYTYDEAGRVIRYEGYYMYFDKDGNPLRKEPDYCIYDYEYSLLKDAQG